MTEIVEQEKRWEIMEAITEVRFRRDLPKMVPSRKAAWLEALRSGEFEQGKHQLLIPAMISESGKDSYCCIGVGKRLQDQEEEGSWDGWGHVADSDLLTWLFGDYEAGLAAFHVFGSNFKVSEADIGPDCVSLTSLNDEHNWTFEEIADLIEEIF